MGVPVCKTQPKTGHAACFAMRKVIVKKGTPGAQAFVVGDGVGSSAQFGPNVTIGPAGGLTPADFASAYHLKPTTQVSQTVAVVDAFNDPNINSDLGTFDAQYGLPACTVANGCLKVTNQTGGSALPANDTTGWSLEETLDVEAVHSVCQTCKIILVEANSSNFLDLGTAVNTAATTLGANEVSNSYGGPESTGVESYYKHSGVVITASAGDTGYFNFENALTGGNSANAPNMPASLNTVVAVGGTSLYLNQTGGYHTETVWNDDGPKAINAEYDGSALGATGGGCSNLFTAQTWQAGVAGYSGAGCGGKRLVNDISADADYLTGLDIYASYNCGTACVTGWSTIGGTSLASPLVAAIFALAGGAQAVHYPAQTLYKHAGSSSFNDVSAGGNGYCDGEGAAQCGDFNSPSTYGAVDCDYTLAGVLNVGDVACDARRVTTGRRGSVPRTEPEDSSRSRLEP